VYNGPVDESALKPATDTAEGRVEHTLFASEEDGWSALRLVADDGRRFTAVGTLLGVEIGDRLRLSGSWVEHPRFGPQLKVATFAHVDPTTLEGIRRFLGSGRIRGLGPRLAERIVEHFGLDTLQVMEQEPRRLLEIRGIGPTTAHRIEESWAAQRGIRQVMVFLTGHGVSPGLAGRIFRRYGVRALEIARNRPYQLAEDIHGVGFLSADRIARNLGLPADAPDRLRAGLVHVLEEATGEGHVFLPRTELLASAAVLLACDPAALEPALADLSAAARVVMRPRPGDEPAVYHPRLEEAEATLAEGLGRILAHPASATPVAVDRALEWYQRQARIELAPRQREALAAALEAKVLVITGGPGTGKTTLVRGVTEVLGCKDARIELAAPTGRAAKRLGESTGRAARTIHRLLEFNPAFGEFARDRGNPLETDLVVIDEASMLDVELAAHLVDAMPPGSRLILVGDADQLPSVGPGNVVADIIASGAVPVVRLTQIFRQAEQSLIVVNAHRVNAGDMPQLSSSDDSDFFFVARDDPSEAADLAIDFAARRIAERFNLDPILDVQVLSPMHRGELGVTRLNERLQALRPPPARSWSSVGDGSAPATRSCRCATTTNSTSSTATSDAS